MEKYGVEEQASHDKKAQDGERQRCPECDSPLLNPETTGVLVCPTCGTQPFEEK